MINIYFFFLVELEFGKRQAEEQYLLFAGNTSNVLQFLVDERMQVGLEPLILQQLLRRVFFGAEVDDLDDPNRRKRRFRFLEGLEYLDDE